MTPFHSLNILVTRPYPQGAALCQLINEQGGQAIHYPTLAFASPPDGSAWRQALSQLGEQEWLIFNSPRAVQFAAGAMQKGRPILASKVKLAKVKLAAVGEKTADALRELGFEVAVYPEAEWSSEALLALPAFQSVQGKKIAIIRGAYGREWLGKTLTERGAHVLSVIAYERILPQSKNDDILQLLYQHKINMIICTSFEGIENLKFLLGDDAWPYLKVCQLLVVSERIKRLAQDLGFQRLWVARNASHHAILEAIKDSL